jgi:hypothetical protein
MASRKVEGKGREEKKERVEKKILEKEGGEKGRQLAWNMKNQGATQIKIISGVCFLDDIQREL